jgi:nucleotide-binding universal stress UspA family protein
MKILFGVDGSTQALSALETLLRSFAYFRDAPALTLLFVHPRVPYKGAVATVGRDVVDRYYEEEAEAALRGARDALTAQGIPFEVDKCVGSPAEEIAKRAEDGKFSMIALGTHGHTALVNLVMGSVATGVVARSKLPVLLLK